MKYLIEGRYERSADRDAPWTNRREFKIIVNDVCTVQNLFFRAKNSAPRGHDIEGLTLRITQVEE